MPLGAEAVSTRCWLLLRRGRIEAAARIAREWTDRIEPRMSQASPAEYGRWGRLLLREATAAHRDGCPDDAAA